MNMHHASAILLAASLTACSGGSAPQEVHGSLERDRAEVADVVREQPREGNVAHGAIHDLAELVGPAAAHGQRLALGCHGLHVIFTKI